jgi:hypothetical protein
MRKTTILLASLFLLSVIARSQENKEFSADSLTGRIIEQVVIFPQEKIHLHLDKPVYLAGETIWFRAHVADAVLHTPRSGQYVYAELIDPLDSVVSRVKIRPDSGAFCGHINLNQILTEGDYTLSAWTENMLNPGADYHFRKQIRVEGPLSASVNTVVDFKYEKNERYTAEVSFVDIKSHKKISPVNLRMRVNRQPAEDVKTDPDTVSRFSFRLTDDADLRTLYIETSRSREFVAIPSPKEDYEVSFLPEGGNIPSGTECRVAFKAVNIHGLPEDVTVTVTDSAGMELTRAETVHDGMGLFYLMAESGKAYYAVCKNIAGLEKRYMLPAPLDGIPALSTEQSGDTLFVSVLSSAVNQGEQNLFLLLHTRGIIHYARPWDNLYGTLSFDTGMFPSGVLQVLLLDAGMKPLSERLVFITGNDQARTELITDRQGYEKRQQVNASVRITAPDGSPRAGSFSVAVTDNSDLLPDTSVTILTSLLLTSELRGNISNPGYYFRKNDPRAAASLDLLMMTNGWRRYDIPSVLTGDFMHMKYAPRLGMEIRGRVRSLVLGKPVKNAEVAAFSWGTGYIEMTRTDSLGQFTFSGIEFPDSTEFVIQALNKTGKPTVELILENELFLSPAALPAVTGVIAGETTAGQQMSSYLTRADTRYTMENGMRTVYIEEVIITAKAPEKKDYSFSYYMPRVSESSNYMLDYEQIEEIHPSNLSEIIYHIPFTRVEGGKVIIESMRFNLNGELAAVLIIDDMIIHDYNIDEIDPYSVERIAVLKGGQTTLLGGDGAGGAIVITTRKGMSAFKDLPKYNIRTTMPLGYQEPAEFYSPRYETEESRETGPPDLRTTIYWNPDVKVSAKGEASFDFYTADSPVDYSVVIEGITDDGLIIRSMGTLKPQGREDEAGDR